MDNKQRFYAIRLRLFLHLVPDGRTVGSAVGFVDGNEEGFATET